MAGGEVKKSDLPTRVGSAVVMVGVAGTALWLGGWIWAVFVALIATGVLVEWTRLANAFVKGPDARAMWLLGGLLYCGTAAFALVTLRNSPPPNDDLVAVLVLVVGAVIATDVCAYFVGRTVGGPKIAAKISPSKTWSGLIGGMVGASIAAWAFAEIGVVPIHPLLFGVIVGPLIAVLAQVGDFFESWMKRRAGVKDSGNMIPGHGGLFDRLDGLLAVLFFVGLNLFDLMYFGLAYS